MYARMSYAHISSVSTVGLYRVIRYRFLSILAFFVLSFVLIARHSQYKNSNYRTSIFQLFIVSLKTKLTIVFPFFAFTPRFASTFLSFLPSSFSSVNLAFRKSWCSKDLSLEIETKTINRIKIYYVPIFRRF